MRSKIKSILSFCSLCSVVLPVFAMPNLPKQARVPGGIAIINLQVTSKNSPEVYYLGNRTCVIEDLKKPQHWVAIVGIPLDAVIGQNQIDIRSNTHTLTQNFEVKPKRYPTEYLTIPDQRKVEPKAEDMALIEKEYLETIATYAHWEQRNLKSLRLSMPAKGRKSSPFGFQRIMNNIPKNPHSGLDIAAALGTKVNCPKDGVVINIGKFFYSGNIVFVDHGQGFITSYCHLNSVTVKNGQKLRQGDQIGTIGKTGRATGPHLHWSVSLNGVRVDPQLFING